MGHDKAAASARAPGNETSAPAIWPTFMFDELLQAQRAQWVAFSAWQQSLLALSRDFWEQWTVRFTGGVPIDA
jgi:hypothetical protein